MAGAAPELRGDPSPADDESRVIECPSTVLQNLRALVLERFNQLPHGGAEAFGVLFGARHGESDYYENRSSIKHTGFAAAKTEWSTRPRGFDSSRLAKSTIGPLECQRWP